MIILLSLHQKCLNVGGHNEPQNVPPHVFLMPIVCHSMLCRRCQNINVFVEFFARLCAHPVHPLFQILDPPTPVEGQSHSTPRGSLAGLAVAVGHRTNSGQSGNVSSQCDLSGH